MWIFQIQCIFVFLYMSFLWLIAQQENNNSIADNGWGIGFLIIAVTSTKLSLQGAFLFLAALFLCLFFLLSKKYAHLYKISSCAMITLAMCSLVILSTHARSGRAFLISMLVFFWATRITYYIFKRSRNKGEDERYAQWRKNWGTHQMFFAFLYVFMLQGFLMLVIGYPIMLLNSAPLVSLQWFDCISVGIWAFGMFWEAIGDYQLAEFLRSPKNKGSIMQEGLWRYTRHPNYFGESVMWWAIFFITLPVYLGWSAIISPLTITFLLRFISGVPLAEKSFAHNPEFLAYAKRTNAMFPWRPRQK
ncbi:MAG TPA: DUF1295 domain-containing protein [Candidatus Babeliales bacterium]|nr:DUF1295 domain-containing protein [Candidatus Babeliales bacterium]